MARQYTQKKTRSIKGEGDPITVDLPRVHRKFLLALLEAAICQGVPFYVNRVYKDGRISFKLFTEREILESYLSPQDDPSADCFAVASIAWDESLGREIQEQGARLEAQERAREAKTAAPEPQSKIVRSGA